MSGPESADYSGPPIRADWLFALVQDVQALAGHLLEGRVWTAALESELETTHPPLTPLERTILIGYAAQLRAQSSAVIQEGAWYAPESSGPGAAKVARARELLEVRFAESWKVQSLAREIGWNRTELSLAFRRQCATSIHQYLVVRRMEAAKRLLIETDAKVEHIAAQVGCSKATLNREFLRLTGLPPSRFRKLLRPPSRQ